MPQNNQAVVDTNVIPTKIDPTSARFEKNARTMACLVEQIRQEEAEIRAGGGPQAIHNQHQKGRLTARERIARLLDADTEWFELSIHSAHGMYAEWGGAPAAGVITGLGKIHGRTFLLIANDATVKAGAFFPMTAKKVIRAQNIASKTKSPRSIWSTRRAYFCRCRRMCFPTRTTSAASFATTP